MSAAPVVQHAHLHLIDETTRDRLVGRLITYYGYEAGEAVGILDATLGFLATVGEHPEAHLVPSEKIDEGWHAFILYTREYAEFCEKVAGHFIHHVPADASPGDVLSTSAHDTVEFMEAHGIVYDASLWTATAFCDARGGGGNDGKGGRK